MNPIPKSFKDVSISCYRSYVDAVMTYPNDKVRRLIHGIAALKIENKSELMKLSWGRLMAIKTKIDFLNDLPIQREIVQFKCSGRTFIVKADINDIIELSHVLANTTDPEKLSCLSIVSAAMVTEVNYGIYLEDGRIFFTKYSKVNIEETEKFFDENLDMETAINLFRQYTSMAERLVSFKGDNCYTPKELIERIVYN